MPHWTYMIRCCEGSFYTGSTSDLVKRWDQHCSGAVISYTATRQPLELVYAEEFETQDEAAMREVQLKKWGHWKKEALIQMDWPALKKLARGLNSHQR